MLYPLLRSFVKFGLNWYVTDWQLKNMAIASLQHPTIVVSNHPNSFFDALVLAVNSPKETRFLVRGDIFKKEWANWTLRTLFMIPIYKKSDDPDFEVMNAFTYDECAKWLKSAENIVIFPEGVSRNSHLLRPFMPTGFTSLIKRAISMDIPVQIQPFVIGYSSFDYIPKSVSLEALSPIDSTDYINDGDVDAARILQLVREEMESAMPSGPVEPSIDYLKSREWMKIPAKAGYYTHNWLYKLVKQQIEKKTSGTIFYDSLMFGVLLFGYPVLVLLISLIIGNIIGFWTGLLFFVLMPFLSYCWVQYQPVKINGEKESLKVNRLN